MTAPHIHNSERKMRTAPDTTLAKVVNKIIANHRIDVRNGKVYGRSGKAPIGSNTYEPRVSVRVDGKKYNARVSKVIGYVMFGVAALQPGNKVVHRNGDKFDNAGKNLQLKKRKGTRVPQAA
jgi:hypothetical protein